MTQRGDHLQAAAAGTCLEGINVRPLSKEKDRGGSLTQIQMKMESGGTPES